jgi:hypothetical protein
MRHILNGRVVRLVNDSDRWQNVPDVSTRGKAVAEQITSSRKADSEMRKAYREAERAEIRYMNFTLGCNGRKLASPSQGRTSDKVVRDHGIGLQGPRFKRRPAS